MNMDLELPGGVITTHCVSSVIRPGSKVTHDPLQFVKIQSAELSKKAVEQIRLAEEVKITKDKIKEVEEEWQNNLLNWKSKRRQSRTTTGCSLTDTEGDHDNEDDDHHHLSHRHHHLSHHLSHHHLSHHHHHDNLNNRKIKTFSEILNDKAKSGYRIGYNLHKYIRDGSEDDDEEEEEDEDEGCKMENDATSRLSSSSDDSADKKIVSQASPESTESQHQQQPPTTTATNESYSGSFKRTGGGCGAVDNDGDDEDDDGTSNDSVDDRSSSFSSSLSSSSKLVNGLTTNSNGGKKSPSPNDNELIDRQRGGGGDDDGQQQLTDQLYYQHHHQQINLKNSQNVDYQHSNGNNQMKKLPLTPSVSLPPIQSKLTRPAICKINSYNDNIKSNDSTTGKKVVLKFKIDKDISRQSSLPLLSSSSSSLSLSIGPCDSETINKRFSSSENEIKEEMNQENETRLSFRDKLSNFENLSKGELDVGTSSSANHLNHCQNLHHSHLQMVRKSTESSASCDKETMQSSSSSEVEIINEITVNQENEPRLSFRDKLSNFENLAKAEELIGSPSSSTNHPPPANPNHLNQPHLLSKDRKSTSTSTPSSSSLSSSSSSSSSSNRISGHPILTSSLSSSSLSTHHHPSYSYTASHLPHHHGEQIKIDQSSTTKLGDKSCSEAQLMMRKLNENLKPNQDQRSMLSISGKKRCSNCGDELGRGCAAMVIETLSLYYHINCFRCSVCHIKLGNGTCGTDVRVRSNRLHCQNCYSYGEVVLTRV